MGESAPASLSKFIEGGSVKRLIRSTSYVPLTEFVVQTGIVFEDICGYLWMFVARVCSVSKAGVACASNKDWVEVELNAGKVA